MDLLELPIEEKPAPTYITLDNRLLLDPETGEMIEPDDKPFSVHDDQSADWVLRKLQEIDADLLALDALYQARVNMLVQRAKALTRQRTWLKNRFKMDLQVYATQQIDLLNSGKKAAKSIKLTYGTLGYRSSAGSIEVREDNLKDAIAWDESHCPAAVSKSILKTPLKAMKELPSHLFESIPPQENFYISTGISVPASIKSLATKEVSSK